MRPCPVALLVLLLLALPTPAPAQPGPHARVFSAEALGANPPESLRIGFTLHYRGAMPHAAFAYAWDGGTRFHWNFTSGLATPQQAEQEALQRCEREAATRSPPVPCRILARDGAVEGRGAVPLQQGELGPFRWAALLPRRGPQAARGVVIWGHGLSGDRLDLRGSATPGVVSALNDAGWDVLRYDRHPGDDELNNALQRLLAGLPAVRAAGYRQVVLGGQSRGGWQSLLAAAEQPEAIAAVIAHAPARHGSWRGGISRNSLGASIDDFRQLVARLPAAGPRVLVAVFEDDDFDPGPDSRAGMVARFAQGRAVPALALWPGTGAKGHGGGNDWRYTRDFAGCTLALLQAEAAAAPRGLRRERC